MQLILEGQRPKKVIFDMLQCIAYNGRFKNLSDALDEIKKIEGIERYNPRIVINASVFCPFKKQVKTTDCIKLSDNGVQITIY